jgi:hypothetical protein
VTSVFLLQGIDPWPCSLQSLSIHANVSKSSSKCTRLILLH